MFRKHLHRTYQALTRSGKRLAPKMKRPRRPVAVRLVIEGFEERVVPTVIYKPVFGAETTSQDSGQHGSQPEVFLIFWGSYWNGPGASQKASVISTASKVVTSTFPRITNQYGANGSGMFIANPVVVDGSSPNSGNFDEGNVDDVVQNQIDNGPLPEPDARNGNDHSTIYVVVTAPNVTSKYSGVTGWNYVGSDVDFNDYDDVGECWVTTGSNSKNTVNLDSFSLTFSHEIAEIMSDWDAEGYEVNPPPGAPGGSGNQIGDYEGNRYAFRMANGVAVQPVWSRADNAWAVDDGTNQKFFLDATGNWNGTRFNGKFALTLNGDQNGSATNDTVTLTQGSSGGVQVTQDGQTATFDPGTITGITVNMKNGNDTINVEKTIAGVPVTINLGSGTDVVNISPTAHNLNNIQGAVTIHFGSGTDSLNVDDQSNASNQTFGMGAGSVSRSGAATITYGSDINFVTVNAGNGNNTFNVSGTEAGLTTTLNTGAGHSTVNVDGTGVGGTFTINEGTGGDDVYLGATVHKLDNLHSTIHVNGNVLGVDNLTVDDQTNSAGQTFTLDGHSITRSGVGLIQYNLLNNVSVLTGTGGATVNVLATTAAITLVGHASGTVNIGNAGSVQQLSGPLMISDPPNGAFATVNVDDSADTTARIVTLDTIAISGASFGRITGLAPSAILFKYADTSAVTAQTGTGGATVNVLATGTPTTLVGHASGTVNIGNAGSVQQILDPLTISDPPAAAYVTVNVDDSADTTARTITLDTAGTFGSITGLAPAAILYKNADTSSVNLDTGAAGATVSALATGKPINLIGSPSGLISLVASDADNTWTITAQDAGTLSSALLAGTVTFSGATNLTGGNGADTFVFADGAGIDGTIDGGGGTNALDYSAYSSSVVVDLQTGLATGVGQGIANIQNVTGGNGGGDAGMYNLLIGNGGNVLTGGFGRRNLLVAGGAASTLNGGDQEDLLIAGSTVYDSDPALAAWSQIAAEWAGSDDFATRVLTLGTGSGVPLLDPSTVFGNGGGNTLNGTCALAWIFSDGWDAISCFDPNSPTVPINP